MVRRERILILAKTYPSPSARNVETSCVAGINENGVMRRLYPVPFRLIEQDHQFKKWQWIDVGIEKALADHRPESHKVDIGSLVAGDEMPTKKDWADRRVWMERMPTFSDFRELDQARKDSDMSIALLRPKKILSLEIKDARNKDWTDEEREKLTRAQMQGDLFSEVQAKAQVRELRKVPYDFYYSYLCDTADGERSFRHKIVDWEAGMLYWTTLKRYGESGWKEKFRAKLEDDFQKKDLMFLMGNQHRFQDQWLIISLFYPPMRPTPIDDQQLSLL